MRLNQEHVKDLARLEKACFSMPWNEEQCAKAFTEQHFAAFGLFSYLDPATLSDKSTLAAYVAFYHALDELEILNIAVDPAFRQQKLGTYLLYTTLQEARKMGIKRAVLEVRTTNTPALKLYENVQFVCVGKRTKYYKDTGEDALIYALNI